MISNFDISRFLLEVGTKRPSFGLCLCTLVACHLVEGVELSTESSGLRKRWEGLGFFSNAWSSGTQFRHCLWIVEGQMNQGIVIKEQMYWFRKCIPKKSKSTKLCQPKMDHPKMDHPKIYPCKKKDYPSIQKASHEFWKVDWTSCGILSRLWVIFWVWPPPWMPVTTRIITCLVGDSY